MDHPISFSTPIAINDFGIPIAFTISVPFTSFDSMVIFDFNLPSLNNTLDTIISESASGSYQMNGRAVNFPMVIFNSSCSAPVGKMISGSFEFVAYTGTGDHSYRMSGAFTNNNIGRY
jgi:hypothetical protein